MTNLNRVAISCRSNTNHQMFKEVDGARCVECKDIMLLTPVNEETYRALPSYIEWHKNRTQKPKQSISIVVDANTDKLQLKLRAIAKHTEALANELDAIDNGWQCDCGSVDYDDTTLHSDNGNITTRTCLECKEQYGIHNDDDLPTRLEGSD